MVNVNPVILLFAIFVIIITFSWSAPLDPSTIEEDVSELEVGNLLDDMVIYVARNGRIDAPKRWPNATVKYKMSSNFEKWQVYNILLAMASLEAVSCVRFRQAGKRTKDFLYIVSTKSNKCNSLIGYQGKKQHLYLDTTNPKCFKPVILMHELLHTLGFYHEHMSPIRDDYITVNWENIVPELKIFFNKVDKETFSDFGFGYDYDSVMHYGRSGFSANGLDTISPLNGNATIGQRMGLSLKDIGKLNAMYKCPMD